MSPPKEEDFVQDFNQHLYKKLFNSPFEFEYQLPIHSSIFHKISNWCVSSFTNNGNSDYINLIFTPQAQNVLFQITNNSKFTVHGGDDDVNDIGHKEQEDHIMASSSSSLNNANSQQTVRIYDDSSHRMDILFDHQQHRAGRICGHVFKKGEPVFRCRTCGYDDTCVMCVQCFRNTDHENHDFYFHISTGGGGCCDCGDNEAWKVKLNCKIHSVTENKPKRKHIPLPEPLVQSMKSTIHTIMDFITDTLADSPFISTDAPDKEQVVASNLPEDEKEIDDNVKHLYKFALVLWNDETHSFNEVINQVCSAVHCNEDFGRDIANQVDQHGREIIMVSQDVKAVCDAGIQVNHINLAVSVRSARETFREEVAGYLLKWLLALTTYLRHEGCPVNQQDTCYESPLQSYRVMFCEAMFSLRRFYKDALLKFDREDIVDSDEEQEVKKMESDNWSVERLGDIVTELRDHSVFKAEIFHSRMRIDELFLADVKLWKSARATLKDIFIRIVTMAGDSYRQFLALRFAYCYLRLTKNHLTHDREHELSVIHFGVQLFTVPSIAALLVADTPLLQVVCACLKTIFLADEQNLKYFFRSFKHSRDEILPLYRHITFEDENFKLRRYDFIFHHLRYLLATPDKNSKGFPSQESEKHWSSVLDLIKIWQGMNPQQRYARQHIEYESDYWLQAFTVAAHIQNLIQTFDICFGPDKQGNETRLGLLCSSIVMLMVRLSAWANAQTFQEIRFKRLSQENRNPESPVRPVSEDGFYILELFKGKPFRIPQFAVSAQHVSFHHPLHWLCAQLMVQLPKYFNALKLSDAQGFWKSIFAFNEHAQHQFSSSDYSNISEMLAKRLQSRMMDADRLLLLCEEPLRVIVLLAQISAGLWVRNGMSLRSQAMHYKEITLPSCADNDIFFLQMFSNVLDADHVMTVLVDRFELTSWFQGNYSLTSSDITPTHFTLIAESFLKFLNVFLTERSLMYGISTEDEIRREIIHHLAAQPNGLAYSELAKKIPERLQDKNHAGSTISEFDVALQELANFKSPIGLSDKGIYELKSEFFEQVDPWFWHYTRNQHEEVEEILKKKFSKSKAKPGTLPFWDLNTEDVNDVRSAKLLHPDSNQWGLDGLDRFVSSSILVQVIYYALWNVTRSTAPGDKHTRSPTLIKSESVLKQAIQLMKVALVLEDLSFTSPSQQQQSPKFSSLATSIVFDFHDGEPSTLFNLLLDLLANNDHEELKEMKARFKYVIKGIMKKSDQASLIYQQWKTELMSKLGITDGQGKNNDAMSEAEKKKQAAKARKAALMQQFAQQQQSFIDNMKDEFEDDEEMEDVQDENGNQTHSAHFFEYPHGNCIVCQETLKIDGPAYGMLGYLQPSLMQRLVDHDNIYQARGILNMPTSLDREDLRVPSTYVDKRELLSSGVETGNPNINCALNLDQQLYGLNVSSCGHLMHHNCFKDYLKAIRDRHSSQTTRNQPENREMNEFMCPLCKSLGNLLLPLHFEKTIETKLEPLNSSSMSTEPIVPDAINRGGLKPLEFATSQVGCLNDIKNILSSVEPNFQWDQDWKSVGSHLLKKVMSFYDKRLGEAILKANFDGLSSFSIPLMGQHSPSIQLWNVFSDTLAHTEIMTRGTGHGHGVLENATPQSTILLRVLAKATRTYTAFSAVYGFGYHEELDAKRYSLLNGIYGKGKLTDNTPVVPALTIDVFSQLTMYTILETNSVNGFNKFLQQLPLFYCMCLLQSVVSILEAVVANPTHWSSQQQQQQYISRFLSESLEKRHLRDDLDCDAVNIGACVSMICDMFGVSSVDKSRLLSVDPHFIYEISASVAHVFLRRCSLLAYAMFNKNISFQHESIVFDDKKSHNDDDGMSSSPPTKVRSSELHRLLQQFGLQKPSYFFSLFKSPDNTVTKCMNGWLKQLINSYPELLKSQERPTTKLTKNELKVHVPLPIVYELVPFPERLDVLLQESMEAKCDRCETTPLNSAWCLLCGKMLCPQSFCCYDPETEYGDLTMHKKECGAGIGLFFLNKKCSIVLLHGDNKGSFMHPPYMDVHGEVDMGLRRGKPLFLNTKRYEEIRKLWLTHGIPSFVARKMEQVYDVGGWMTF